MIELVEAEARQLRRATIETGFALGLLVFAGLIVAAGIALLGWAFYLFLAARLGTVYSALIVGSVAILIGGGILWRIRHNFH